VPRNCGTPFFLPEALMNQDEPTAQPQGDFFNNQAERLQADLQNFSRQVASCDKLIRMANISLNQIDDRIAEAVQVEARAAAIVEASGRAASLAATEAATNAVAASVAQLTAVTAQAQQVCRAIDRSHGKAVLWNAAYIACALAACLLTGYVTYRIGKAAAITPEIEHAVELAARHETLLNKATDKEKKQIADIVARRAKNR
jgi:SUMO ligase MMS21 Smc5/6 complex component